MAQLKINSVTLDTNVFPAEGLINRAKRAGMIVGVISVSRREVEGSSLEDEVGALECTLETAVWGESRWGHALWGGSGDNERLENMLALVSNGSFPPRGQRENLSNGQRRQLRDAMILFAHIREGRDLLVTNDKAAFIVDSRRAAIETAYKIKIMTANEFETYLDNLERDTTV